jgi:hemerythrin superfamily protein
MDTAATARAALGKLAPPATKQIRMDHAHVMATFHKYSHTLPADRQRAIVETVCTALEIHAQLEEEIFYPALDEVAADHEALRKARPEHEEMRRLIGVLRGMQPGDPGYPARFMELMRDVMHHVADEESLLLPAAETLMPQRLAELGTRMAERRIELAGPRLGDIAANAAKAMPGSTMLMAGGLLAGGYLLSRALHPHRRH